MYSAFYWKNSLVIQTYQRGLLLSTVGLDSAKLFQVNAMPGWEAREEESGKLQVRLIAPPLGARKS